MSKTGVISIGIKTPIIREGDDLSKIVVDAVLNATEVDDRIDFETKEPIFYDINDKDIIGITESVVARAYGNYVTVDEIAFDIQKRFNHICEYIVIANPIYSRNRFSMLLKAIARSASKGVIIYMPDFDEVGNPSGVNLFTGVDIKKYYTEIVNAEGKKCIIHNCAWTNEDEITNKDGVIYCGLHDYLQWKSKYGNEYHITLVDICSDKCEYGLLGSNKATEEKLKLFPSKESAEFVVNDIQQKIYEATGSHVEVMIYGDGCFKDPVGGIWEFADPVVSPAYTKGLEGTPNEIKIKAFADDEFKDFSGDELVNKMKEKIASKDKNLVGNMQSQGTTPRRFVDLLGSLMDLTSGSGDKGTPVVLVKNYFNNYSN